MSWLERLRRWFSPPEGAARSTPPPEEDDPTPDLAARAMPLDGELDLHSFRPAEVGDVVEAYVRACRDAHVLGLRVVHGKGKGALRRTVHARLARLPEVREYRLAPPERGGWGATLVDLHPPTSGPGLPDGSRDG